MNDANEIKYGAELFKAVVAKRQNQETNQTLIDFLVELKDWTNQLIGLPHYIFVFSLTEKGNLLSQWRAYTPSGEAGVSDQPPVVRPPFKFLHADTLSGAKVRGSGAGGRYPSALCGRRVLY